MRVFHGAKRAPGKAVPHIWEYCLEATGKTTKTLSTEGDSPPPRPTAAVLC
jgi:hypothetical protein